MSIWRYIEKARYRLSKEEGFYAKSWAGRSHVVLIYPNTYYVGMSNLGFHVIYRIINEHKGFSCDRAFYPESGELREVKEKGVPIIGIESQKPLAQFDIIAFSISFEKDFINVLEILKLSGIPLRREQRSEFHPLIIAGGVACFINPEPLAEFIDLFIIGEGEDVLRELLDLYESCKLAGVTKSEFIREAIKIPGVYAPSFYSIVYDPSGRIKEFIIKNNAPARIKKRKIDDLNRYSCSTVIFTEETEFGDMFLIEINRGCPMWCRFCASGYLYRNPRFRDFNILTESIRRGMERRKKVGIIGTAVMDHPDIVKICKYITDMGGKVSFSSLRADSLNEEIVSYIRKSNQLTVSLAPEAGTERLRRIINKSLSDEDLFHAAELLASNGINNLKLYFMIGLPAENDDDVRHIGVLAKKIRHRIIKATRGNKTGIKLILNISPFIPKPHTPFQLSPFIELREFKRKMRMIENEVKNESSIIVHHDLPKWGYLQCLMSRGDRRVGSILEAAVNEDGDFFKASRKVSINPDFYVYREIGEDELMPWELIDTGFDKDMLLGQWRSALQG